MQRSVYDTDHEQFRDSVRDFLQRDVAPNLESFAHNKLIDRQVWRSAANRASSASRSRGVWGW